MSNIKYSARLLACVFILLPLRQVEAQRSDSTFVCTGELVSRVDIEPSPPPFAGAAKKWQAAARAIGLHHATTTADVVAAFLSLSPGKACTERRRTESERVLRAQPFLSDAVVRVVRDTGGTVAVRVSTTDEIPVLVSGRFRGVVPDAFSLGNENIGGQALRVVGRVERGRSYQTAYGIGVEEDMLFGHPFRLVLNADRFRIGERVVTEVEHPFFTDLQRVSWHAGYSTGNGYRGFERAGREPLALQVDDRSWDVSSLTRLFGTQTVGLLGGALTGRRVDPASAGIVIDDTGLRADTGTALRGRYSSFRAVRVGILGGVRRVSFQSVNGFDALVGSQDAMRGAALGVFAARGLARFGEEDYLLSGAFYAGTATRNFLLANLALVEGAHDPNGEGWNSVIGSNHTSVFWGSAPGVVLALSNEYSGGSKSVLPLQVTFADRDGGLIGYHYSGLAGAQRNVAHGEVRWSGASVMRHADIGFAAFTEVGTLWAGDAPYGVNATRASVGVSVLAAYPSHAKRMYRADLAIPLTRAGEGKGRIELRFSSLDRTQSFATEPPDVSAARTGTEPAKLFAWPTR
ncbi:MAG: hypothetical protein M3Z05_20040 [Gemmatimonadota bacterium]|nr:hypothetical protein [Gemmatimonadota bacterium]